MITIAQLKSKTGDRKTPNTPQTRSSVNSPQSKSMQNIQLRSRVYFQHTTSKGLQSIQETPKEMHTRRNEDRREMEKTHSAHSSNTFVTGFELVQHPNAKFLRVKQRQKYLANFKSQSQNQLIQLNPNILEIYNEYEKNYKAVGQLDRFEPVQTYSIFSQEQRQQSQQYSNHVTTFDGLKQSDLETSGDNIIKINRFQFYYLRAKLYGQISPVQIFFNCPERIQSSNLRIFLSTKAEFPSKFNADHVVTSKYAKIYSFNNQQFFTEHFLFITFYSEQDFDVNIEIVFGNPIQRTIKKKKISETDNYQIRTASVRSPKRDKITQNLDMAQYQSCQKLRRILSIQSERCLKQKLVQVVKRELFEEQKSSKLSKLIVKDQIIEYREFEKKTKAKIKYDQEIQKQWLKMLALAAVTDLIDKCMQNQKYKKKIEAKSKLLIWVFKSKQLMQVKKQGQTPKERTIFKAKLTIKLFTQQLRSKVKKQAQSIITDFMQQILLFLTLTNKQQSTLKKSNQYFDIQLVIRIQRRFRHLKIKKKNYKEKMWRMVREKLNEVLQSLKQQNIYQDNKKSNHHIQIDLPIMQSMIDEYTQSKKDKWGEYISHTILQKNLKQKIIDMAVNFKQPKLYELPNETELKDIIYKYAKLKQII